MPRRKPAPYVKLSIVALADPDYLTLMRTAKGRAALGCWHFALLMFRQDVWRGGEPGRMRHGIANLSTTLMLGDRPWRSAERWRAAFARIAEACRANGNEPWIAEDGDDLVIRNWAKYNDRIDLAGSADPPGGSVAGSFGVEPGSVAGLTGVRSGSRRGSAHPPGAGTSEAPNHLTANGANDLRQTGGATTGATTEHDRNTGGPEREPSGSGTGSRKQVAHDGPIEQHPTNPGLRGLAREVFLDCAARAGHQPRLSAEEARTLASTFRQQEMVPNPEERRDQVLAALEWASGSDDVWFRQASMDSGMLGRQFGKIWAAWLALHPEARSPRSGERDASAAQHSTPVAPPLKPRRRGRP
jgi:hypothetical protein